MLYKQNLLYFVFENERRERSLSWVAQFHLPRLSISLSPLASLLS